MPPPPQTGRNFQWHVPLLVLGGLMVLPALTAFRLASDMPWYLLPGMMALMSAISYGGMAADKRKAQEQLWRIPEAHLHGLELLGGWPGSYLAQRRHRHKTAKSSYEAVFWLIVTAWQVGCWECLSGGKHLGQLLPFLSGTLK